jgi:hypothetical protein
MPDGSIAEVDVASGFHAGDLIEVVYWPDDQADAESPIWPTKTVFLATFVALGIVGGAVAGVYRLVGEPVRFGLPVGRYRSGVPTPARRTYGQNDRARRARKVARRSRTANRRR